MDAGSGAALTEASIGGRSFIDGVENDIAPVFVRELDADGSFGIVFSTYFGRCPVPDFPRPDQLEIIVVRDRCEQRVTIEINEDTAQFVDGEFPGEEVLELKDPILVPPCDESP